MEKTWLDQLPVSNILSIQEVGGGDVNQAYRLETDQGDIFLLRQENMPETFYDNEIMGLKEFEKHGITAPRVYASGQIAGDAFLLMEYIEEGRGRQEDLGRLVANMHQVKSENNLYGFDSPYIGSHLTISNEWTDSWIELFVERRLDAYVEEVRKKGLFSNKDFDAYLAAREIMVSMLEDYQASPSLLHGDLWPGNVMFNQESKPYLFDPHVFYGDREFDLGVSTVFSGFSPDFYQGYQETYPLEKGYQERLSFYRLYLLLVHLNKFGHSYYSSVMAEIRQIQQYNG